ncbi:helix-turn-helix transcriptional regulator [Paenibacillus motobuensis]
MHRIHWFDQRIREGKYPNSGHIAEQFEISRRQAQRDIEYMTSSLRAPLLYIARHRGYCYEDKTYVLPHLYMTEEEQKVLKYLAYRYRQYDYDNGETIQRIAHVLDRFTAGNEDDTSSRLPQFELNPRIIQNFEKLSQAIKDAAKVDLIYLDDEGGPQHARMYPLQFISRYNADYVVVYCELERQQLMLRLDRLLQVQVLKERFELDFAMDMDAVNRHYTPRRKPFVACVILANPHAEHSWYGYRIVAQHELEHEVEFYDTDAFLQHLLTTPWISLKSPKWLRQKLMVRCQQTIERLQNEE